jgi:hypothetical protein
MTFVPQQVYCRHLPPPGAAIIMADTLSQPVAVGLSKAKPDPAGALGPHSITHFPLRPLLGQQ